MIRIITTILFFLQIAFSQIDSSSFITYKWLGENAETTVKTYEVELHIPKNFEQKNWYCGEGVITKLLFSDSCLVTLHFGFTMKIPLLDEPEYLIKDKGENENYTYRNGINKETKLFWEEFNFKNFPINAAISNIPKNNIKLFENILKSIKISEM